MLFICQDDVHRDQFIAAADRELTGHRRPPDIGPERHGHVGRKRILFASEVDAHDARLEARRLPAFPNGHPSRVHDTRRVYIAPIRTSQATTTPGSALQAA